MASCLSYTLLCLFITQIICVLQLMLMLRCCYGTDSNCLLQQCLLLANLATILKKGKAHLTSEIKVAVRFAYAMQNIFLNTAECHNWLKRNKILLIECYHESAVMKKNEQNPLILPIALGRLSLTILIGKSYFIKSLKSFCY